MSVVLVTGASGFIGSAAVAALRRAGFSAIAGVRRGVAPGATVACDLDNPTQTFAALRGVDIVVHAALGDNAAAQQQLEILLAAMDLAGVRRLIALSSLAIYGAASGRVDESAKPEGALDAYARAKLASEARIRVWARTGERRAMLMRPGSVYGAGSRFWIDKLAQRIRLGAWGQFGAQGEGAAPLIHVDDLAAAIVTAARGFSDAAPALPEEAPALAVNLVGPETPSWNDYFQTLANRLGAGSLPHWCAGEIARRQALAVPAKLARRAGFATNWIAKVALAPTPGEIALFSRRADYATEVALAFGMSPQIGLDEGLARSKLG